VFDDAGEPEEPCEEGESEACGSDVGACRKGTRVCEDGVFGACEGGVEAEKEVCNGVDDDCDGTTDEDFHLGEACDGPDSDRCTDDRMTCNGCSARENTLETCDGVDNDCDGVIDSDCETGDCQPKLFVTGSTPSEPGCVDFPVERGTGGIIEYPCGGGFVTATLGSVEFSGSVQDGHVSLSGTQIISADVSPDGCVWETTHTIEGALSSGSLAYAYAENFVEGVGCWFPCTESGTIQITW
jgi:hypothetical protein